MLRNYRDFLLCLIVTAILGLGVFCALVPESLGSWLQRVDNARFYNTPLEYE